VEEDPVPELPPTPDRVPGIVYELGRTDCSAATAPVQRTSSSCSLASASRCCRRYNVAYEGAAGSVMNDSMSPERFLTFLTDAFRACDSVMPPGTAFYLTHADTEGLAFRAAVQAWAGCSPPASSRLGARLGPLWNCP
jgi:hypothetical protein